MLNFIAIDFETANESRNSACAIGAAVVVDGQIVERRYTLINPKMQFQHFCTLVHGITTQTVQDAPVFEQVHPTLFKLLDGNTVAAHNASFDIAVLRESCNSRNLPFPDISAFDSVEMSRKAWPELAQHKLNTLAEHFNFPLKHHNAIEDATACALLVLHCAKQYDAGSIEELSQILQDKSAKDNNARIQRQKQRQKLIEKAKRDLALENTEDLTLQIIRHSRSL